MFCNKCGAEIDINDKFCNSCGEKIENKVIATVDIDGNVLTMKLAE